MIGMNIGSQMTQEEVIEYARRVLTVAGLDKPAPAMNEAQHEQLRAQAVLAVVQVCGRPIAKAEIAAIAKAEKQFDEARDERAGVVGALSRGRELAKDSPFKL